jgi:cell filamentation protein
MSNSYKYIDPDYTYTDPKTGLLRNVQNITDPDVLLFVESGAVTKRLQELYENPIKIKGIESLLKFTNNYFKTYTLGLEKNGLLKLEKTENNFFQLHILTMLTDTLKL